MTARIVLLTHTANDLAVLQNAVAHLPAEFPTVTGIALQTLERDNAVATLLSEKLPAAEIVVLRILGRPGAIPGFTEMLRHARARPSPARRQRHR